MFLQCGFLHLKKTLGKWTHELKQRCLELRVLGTGEGLHDVKKGGWPDFFAALA
jgi:hypothetical protein